MRRRYTREQSEDRFNTFLSVFFVTVLFGGLLYAMFIINPIEQQEKITCNKLQKQAEDYKNFMYSETNPGGFYITKADKQMCNDLGIEINAPIK
jgi:hypothetical protein